MLCGCIRIEYNSSKLKNEKFETKYISIISSNWAIVLKNNNLSFSSLSLRRKLSKGYSKSIYHFSVTAVFFE